jgi:hypothetical protein
MFSVWPLYLLLFLVVVAWLRVEIKNKATSRGIGSIILGCLILSYGFSVWDSDIQIFRWLTIATGFAMAFYGVAKLVSHMVTHDLKSNS